MWKVDRNVLEKLSKTATEKFFIIYLSKNDSTIPSFIYNQLLNWTTRQCIKSQLQCVRFHMYFDGYEVEHKWPSDQLTSTTQRRLWQLRKQVLFVNELQQKVSDGPMISIYRSFVLFPATRLVTVSYTLNFYWIWHWIWRWNGHFRNQRHTSSICQTSIPESKLREK